MDKAAERLRDIGRPYDGDAHDRGRPCKRLKALLDAKARLARDGEARLVHATHRNVERGAAGLRFEGPEFRLAER